MFQCSLFLLSYISTISYTQTNGPNIVFIMVDDSGWGNWGYHNNGTNGEIITPNVDSLARTGLILNRHYVHYVSSPTRTSFQSRRLPVHRNIEKGVHTRKKNELPINYTC
eukprot:96754_1